MNDRSSQKQNLSGLMVLLLFGVFAVCILSVLISGTRVYDRLTARDQGAYDARTASQYLTTRMHQAQSSDAVSVRLCELFLFSDAEADLENGEHILPADALEAETDGGLITMRIRDDGGEQVVRVLLRGGEVRP